MLRWMILISFAIVLSAVLQSAESCNEAVCGSIVSKCLLTQSCKCDYKKDCTCCKECANCLSYLYGECCSCVDMCPKSNDTRTSLNKQSHVEDLDSFPALFNALTESPDNQDRWASFMISFDHTMFTAPNDIKYHMQSIEQDVIPINPNNTVMNCTVAFWPTCMSWDKCKESCRTMGAAAMRWFHDGCCECVGDHCLLHYGVNQSMCSNCSIDYKETNNLSDEVDYGEDDFDDEDV